MNFFDEPFGATPLDDDERQGLKLKHIVTRDELNRWEHDNIHDALGWLERTRQQDVLSEKFITTLHQKMFGQVWAWAGSFRTSGKNIGVDWQQISIHLRTLIDDVHFWIENETYAPDEIAARFHHKLVWIHVFPNGNGRHARLMTDVLMKKILNIKPFSWAVAEMSENDIRKTYLEALREADVGNYDPLLNFVRTA